MSEVIKPRICGEAYLPQSPAGEGQTHSLSPRLASWTRTQAKVLRFYLLLFPMQVSEGKAIILQVFFSCLLSASLLSLEMPGARGGWKLVTSEGTFSLLTLQACLSALYLITQKNNCAVAQCGILERCLQHKGSHTHLRIKKWVSKPSHFCC